MKPIDVQIHPIGILTDAFGDSKIEAAAALAVRWHHVNSPDAWQGVSRTQLADFLSNDETAREWALNPFWRPDPRGLVDGGWLAGWVNGDASALGRFTEKALHAIEHRGSWCRKAPK